MDARTKKTLHKNIHSDAKKLPVFYTHSKFFAYAATIEALGDALPSFVKATRQPFPFAHGTGMLLTITLDIPNFPKTVAKPTILVLDTPENNAMTIGRLAVDDRGKLFFQLPRFHTGVPAQDDMAEAMRQAAHAAPIKKLLASRTDPARQSFLLYITREGQLINWHHAVYDATHQDIPFTIVHAEHVAGNIGGTFGRITKVCPINREGLNSAKLNLLCLADNTASGIQHVAVLEELLARVKEENHGTHKIRDLLIASPLMTLYGAMIISLWAAKEEGIATTIVASGALLGCNPPDRYFSPLLSDERLTANPKLIAVNHRAHGANAAGRACVRGNWTASFMAPRYAMERSKEELALYCSSNEELLKNSQTVTVDFLKSLGIDIASLIPTSTREQAEYLGKHLLY